MNINNIFKPKDRTYIMWFYDRDGNIHPQLLSHVADEEEALALAREYGFTPDQLYNTYDYTSALNQHRLS